MGAGRKVGSESEAQRCLAEVQRSGLTIKEWARAHGFDGRSVHAWQMNFSRATKGSRSRRRSRAVKTARHSSTPRLVEIVSAPASPGRPEVHAPRYVLRVGVATVEFGDDFSTDTLRRVITVLRSC